MTEQTTKTAKASEAAKAANAEQKAQPANALKVEKEAPAEKAIAKTEKVAKTTLSPAPKKATATNHPRIKVKQIASGAGRIKVQNATLRGLGLGKVNRVVELEDTAAVRGMIRVVSHLVEIVR